MERKREGFQTRGKREEDSESLSKLRELYLKRRESSMKRRKSIRSCLDQKAWEVRG